MTVDIEKPFTENIIIKATSTNNLFQHDRNRKLLLYDTIYIVLKGGVNMTNFSLYWIRIRQDIDLKTFISTEALECHAKK